MTGFRLVISCMPLEYVGEENVPVFVLFLHFHWNNMPVLERGLYTFLNRPSTSSQKAWKLWSKITMISYLNAPHSLL